MERKLAAEFVGTFLLVFLAVGAAVFGIGGGVGLDGAGPASGTVGVALAFGLVVLMLAYAFGPVSGTHVNPAVTLGLVLAKRMPAVEGAAYAAAQCAGAIAGAAMLKIFVTSFGVTDRTGALGTNSYDNGSIDMPGAFVLEVLLTAAFVLVILLVTEHVATAAQAGVAIGLALTAVHLVGIPLTGTSVNPARSLGPALFEGGTALSQLWLFILAPLAGGALAASLWKLTPRRDEVRGPGRGLDPLAGTAHPSRPDGPGPCRPRSEDLQPLGALPGGAGVQRDRGQGDRLDAHEPGLVTGGDVGQGVTRARVPDDPVREALGRDLQVTQDAVVEQHLLRRRADHQVLVGQRRHLVAQRAAEDGRRGRPAVPGRAPGQSGDPRLRIGDGQVGVQAACERRGVGTLVVDGESHREVGRGGGDRQPRPEGMRPDGAGAFGVGELEGQGSPPGRRTRRAPVASPWSWRTRA